MPDQPSYQPADATRVNVNIDAERAYWCQQLNCTEQDLLDAVRAVGELLPDVRRWLLDRRY